MDEEIVGGEGVFRNVALDVGLKAKIGGELAIGFDAVLDIGLTIKARIVAEGAVEFGDGQKPGLGHKVGEGEIAAGFEDAPCFLEELAAIGKVKNTFHGEDAIAGCIRKGQFTGVPFHPGDLITGAGGDVLPGLVKLAGVDVEAGQIHAGKLFIEAGDRAAKTTADIKNCLPIAHQSGTVDFVGELFGGVAKVCGGVLGVAGVFPIAPMDVLTEGGDCGRVTSGEELEDAVKIGEVNGG